MTGDGRTPFIAALRGQIREYFEAFERSLARPDAHPTTRNLPNGALAALYLGLETVRAEKLLRRLFAVQERNENSPHYGEVPWSVGRPEIVDRNAEVFSSQALGPILLEYGGRLSPQIRSEMTPAIRAFFAALQRRNLRTPAYTNIYVMRFVSLILMGEAIGDRKAADWGYERMDEWLRYTQNAGVHEFNSPTYTAVDLNSLYLGYRFARRPGARAKFGAVLDFFWTDLAANYFAGRGSYSGPHSRDYDFIGGGKGGVGYYYAACGLADDGTSNMLDFEKIYPLFNTDPSAGNYRPPRKIRALALAKEKIVRSRWDLLPGRDRYHCVTPDFAIGGASGEYGPQDRMVSVELASRKKIPVISIVPDLFDAPYGRVKRRDGSGHDKAAHLPLGATCVQEKSALLVLCDIDLRKAGEASETVSTSLLLPAFADALVLDGRPVPIQGPLRLPAAIGSVVGVREGRAGVAARLFGAQGLDSETPAVLLQADAEGLKDGAARLTVYHYRGAPRRFASGSLRVGFLLVAARCRNDADLGALVRRLAGAEISGSEAGVVWSVSAALPAGPTLSASRDCGRREILYRRVDNKDLAPFPPLSINGEEIPLRA